MPAAHLSIVDEVDAAISNGSADKRLDTIKRVTDLFLSSAGSFNGEQIELFGNVLERLVKTIELRTIADVSARIALAEMSVQLAPVPQAPPNVIRLLVDRRSEIEAALNADFGARSATPPPLRILPRSIGPLSIPVIMWQRWSERNGAAPPRASSVCSAPRPRSGISPASSDHQPLEFSGEPDLRAAGRRAIPGNRRMIKHPGAPATSGCCRRVCDRVRRAGNRCRHRRP